MMTYCKVDTLQILWTLNCEHGFIQGISFDKLCGSDDNIEEEEKSNVWSHIVSCWTTPDGDFEFVKFGLEQLLAWLPVEWLHDNRERGYFDVTLPKELTLDGSL